MRRKKGSTCQHHGEPADSTKPLPAALSIQVVTHTSRRCLSHIMLQQTRQFAERPNVIRDTDLHCCGNTKGLMKAT